MTGTVQIPGLSNKGFSRTSCQTMFYISSVLSNVETGRDQKSSLLLSVIVCFWEEELNSYNYNFHQIFLNFLLVLPNY